MKTRTLTADDTPSLVDKLTRRRRTLLPHAPIFWNPHPDQADIHAAYLSSLLTSGEAMAWQSGSSVLVAARGRSGWVLDDVAVNRNHWTDEGMSLWTEFDRARSGQPAVFVCPAYEPHRIDFARSLGFEPLKTWWLQELSPGKQSSNDEPAINGATAHLVSAPPVYAPGGPMLLLTDVTPTVDLDRVLPAAEEQGCAGVVIETMPDDTLDDRLTQHGFRPHCRYFILDA